ncbi:MAG: hypothetical protein ABFD16_14930 [Thermoguttaceae bacterium]|jgi:hypothetical protein
MIEYLTLLLAALFLWWFFFEVTDRRLSAERKAGRLLLRLRRRGTTIWIIAAFVFGVVSILFGILLFALDFTLPKWIMVTQGWIYFMLIPFNSAMAIRVLSHGVELREHGLVRGMIRGVFSRGGDRLQFTPWSEILYCRWLRPPGRLFIQCRHHNETNKLAPEQIPQATAVLSKFVTVRDAAAEPSLADSKPSPAVVASHASEKEDETKPELIGFQFTLRMLMVFVLSVSAFCSWIGIKVQQSRQQQRALAPLLSFQPNVDYRGVYVAGVAFATFSAKKPADADLATLPGLDRLLSLDLSNAPITDQGLVYIKPLTRLEMLNLNGTHVTAAGVRDLMQALPHTVILWKAPSPPVQASGAR